MDDLARFEKALALVESNDNPEAWGDHGQAMGRWQVHPAIVWEYGPESVPLNATWDWVCQQTVEPFFRDRMAVHGNIGIAEMEWNKGISAVKAGVWDIDRAKKFNARWDVLAYAS
jgi:hypothetical protein